jgi:hypothetical protein
VCIASPSDGEAAGVHHRRDDVLAMGERDDRKIDPEHVAELVQRISAHRISFDR